ncbi:MAG: hypothetical protein RLZZ526_1008 [Actinomycetota bacterium]
MGFRWGIASTGNIAGAFARGLANVPDATLDAVGSRSIGSARRFAEEHGVPRAHGSVEDLAADGGIDVVYVAGVHPVHMEHAVMLLESGKHVLVEKPMAMTTGEADRMIDASRSAGRFLMEAMWMRFNPLHVEIERRISAGEFGALRRITSDFSFDRPFDPAHRLFDPAKGGGAMLDVGIYPLHLAWWLLGRPDDHTATGRLGPTGVDDSVRIECRWSTGAEAVLTCGTREAGSMESVIECEDAVITIGAPSHAQNRASISRDGMVEQVEMAPASLHHQVFEVHDCLSAGLTMSDRMTHADSRAILAMMTEIVGSLSAG